MSDRSLFFNSNWWMGFLKDRQAVRYLEELWRRSGGAQPPALDLGDVVNQITQIDQSVSQLGSSLNQLRQVSAQMANEVTRLSFEYAGHIKALERRMSGMEAALLRDRPRTPDYSDSLHDRLKKIEHRINQLENEL